MQELTDGFSVLYSPSEWSFVYQPSVLCWQVKVLQQTRKVQSHKPYITMLTCGQCFTCLSPPPPPQHLGLQCTLCFVLLSPSQSRHCVLHSIMKLVFFDIGMRARWVQKAVDHKLHPSHTLQPRLQFCLGSTQISSLPWNPINCDSVRNTARCHKFTKP